MSFHIRWFGISCFEIQTQSGETIVIDPYITESVSCPYPIELIERCDTIIISHGHYDHILDTGELVRRLNPRRIICNSDASKSLQKQQGIASSLIDVVSFGDCIKAGFFKLDVVKGIHNNSQQEYKRLRGEAIPKSILSKGPIEALKFTFQELSGTSWLPDKFEEWMEVYPGGDQLNFVLTLSSGERIYVAGSYPEEEIISSAKKRDAVDLMLLQIMSSDKLIGLEKETFSFAAAARSKWVVPHHFDQLMKGSRPTEMTALRQLFEKADMPFTEMEMGVWYSFSHGSLEKDDSYTPSKNRESEVFT